MAKQRYILDFDDVLNVSFVTKANADALLSGLNGSGADGALGIAVGGLGNKTFVQGKTLIFDGTKIVSSSSDPIPPSSGPLTNDDRYYTKDEINAFFSSLGNPSGIPVAYANITGAPSPGHRYWFLNTPITIRSGTTVMSSPVEYAVVPEVVGQTIVAALVTCTCALGSPDSGGPAYMLVQKNLAAPQVDLGWFWAGGSQDATAGCNSAAVQVDASAQSFFYQQVNNFVAGGSPIVLKLIGYIYF